MATVFNVNGERRAETDEASMLAGLLPSPIVTRGGRVDDLQEPLHPLEAVIVEEAVPRRIREFTAGRTAARRALKALGYDNAVILSGPRREPLWPTGVVGSISHAAGYCMAAVCPRSSFAGVGIDLEQATPLSESLIDLVCTSREREWAERHAGGRSSGLLGKFVFSAKESVFKCLYPVFGAELDFDEVDLDIDLHNGRYVARVSRFSLNSDCDIEVNGRLNCTAHLVMTAAVLQECNRGLSLSPARAFGENCAGRFICSTH